MTKEEHISNLQTIGCDGWTVTTEAYKSLQFAIESLEQEPILNKIKDEIDKQEKWLLQAGYNAYNVDIAFDAIKAVVAESEVEDADNKRT